MPRLKLQVDGQPPLYLAGAAMELALLLAELADDINGAAGGSVTLHWGQENVSAEVTKRGMKRPRMRAA